MGILIYQIGIFIAIQIAAFFGESARNVAIILISIFTILQVFTSGLMIIQFLTVFISYLVSKKIVEDNSNSEKSSSNNIKFNSSFKNNVFSENNYQNLSSNIRYFIETERSFDLAEILVKLELEEDFQEINFLKKGIKYKSFGLYQKVERIRNDLKYRNHMS